MTELAIGREPARENGNGWRSTIMGGLFTVLVLVIGWIATDVQTSRAEMTRKISEEQQKNSDQAQQIAVLEEAMRGLMRSVDRIESGVNELRRDPRRQR